jgi:hypothetical protein
MWNYIGLEVRVFERACALVLCINPAVTVLTVRIKKKIKNKKKN